MSGLWLGMIWFGLSNNENGFDVLCRKSCFLWRIFCFVFSGGRWLAAGARSILGNSGRNTFFALLPVMEVKNHPWVSTEVPRAPPETEDGVPKLDLMHCSYYYHYYYYYHYNFFKPLYIFSVLQKKKRLCIVLLWGKILLRFFLFFFKKYLWTVPPEQGMCFSEVS